MREHARLPQNLSYPVEVETSNIGYNADIDVRTFENEPGDFPLEDEIKLTKEVKRYVFKKKPEDEMKEEKHIVVNEKADKVKNYGKTAETDQFKFKKPTAVLKKAQSVQTTKMNPKTKQIDENVNYTNFRNTDLVTVCKLNSQTKNNHQKVEQNTYSSSE